MLTTGFDGGNTITSASAIAASTPGAGCASSAPSKRIFSAGGSRVQADPELLEVHRTQRAVRAFDVDQRGHRVVAHRQQAHPGLPAGAQRRGGLRERRALAQHPGPHQVGRDVLVAEGEPVRRFPVGAELVLHRPGLLGAAPALLRVDAAAEGVHHGVQVRAHVQPEQRDVVAGVADHRHLGAGMRVRQVGEQSPQEAGGPDSAGEHGDAHAGMVAIHVRSVATGAGVAGERPCPPEYGSVPIARRHAEKVRRTHRFRPANITDRVDGRGLTGL